MPENQTAEIIQLFRSKPSDQAAEGLRLIRAFMQIDDRHLREAIVSFAEQLVSPRSASSGSSGCP